MPDTVGAMPESDTLSSGLIRLGGRDQQPGSQLRHSDAYLAVTLTTATLGPLPSVNWARPASGLTWTCYETLAHIAEALDWYCLNLTMPLPASLPTSAIPKPAGTVAHLLGVIERRGVMLTTLALTTDPAVRGYHVWGRPDALGYIAMACAEALLHTADIARGLGAPFQPPDSLCEPVLARLFPWASSALSGWDGLLWATGRLELPGHGRVAADWAWHASPLSEWDGQIMARDRYAVASRPR